jgi:hypothetical protein
MVKLRCDGPLSIVAFNFNLRRYNPEGMFGLGSSYHHGRGVTEAGA